MTKRGRGKPVKPATVEDHLMLVLRVKERVDKGQSIRSACEIVQRKYYPGRSAAGVRQTYVELTTPKAFARAGAVSNSYGYISADQWELSSQARRRLIDLCKRIEFYLYRHGAREDGRRPQPIGLIGRAAFPASKSDRPKPKASAIGR